MENLNAFEQEVYLNRMKDLHSQTVGNLWVKEYPAQSVHAGHLKNFINELKIKKSKMPDVIMVDYLNLCLSSQMKSHDNSYNYIKSIAVELRAIGQEYDIPVWSATQTNRSGHDNSNVDLSNTSESWGLPSTADFMAALTTNQQLAAAKRLQVIVLKNRYGDLTRNTRFLIGCDYSKMQLFDVDPTAGLNLLEEDKPDKVEPHQQTWATAGFDGIKFDE